MTSGDRRPCETYGQIMSASDLGFHQPSILCSLPLLPCLWNLSSQSRNSAVYLQTSSKGKEAEELP